MKWGGGGGAPLNAEFAALQIWGPLNTEFEPPIPGYSVSALAPPLTIDKSSIYSTAQLVIIPAVRVGAGPLCVRGLVSHNTPAPGPSLSWQFSERARVGEGTPDAHEDYN